MEEKILEGETGWRGQEKFLLKLILLYFIYVNKLLILAVHILALFNEVSISLALYKE